MFNFGKSNRQKKNDQRPGSFPKKRKLAIEALEDRALLSVVTWDIYGPPPEDVHEALMVSPYPNQFNQTILVRNESFLIESSKASNAAKNGRDVVIDGDDEYTEVVCDTPEDLLEHANIILDGKILYPILEATPERLLFDPQSNGNDTNRNEDSEFGFRSGSGGGESFYLNVTSSITSSVDTNPNDGINLLLEQRAYVGSQTSLENVDYLTVHLPALPDQYSAKVTLGGTALWDYDYRLYTDNGSNGYSTVYVSNGSYFTYHGGSGGMDVYVVPVNNSSIQAENKVVSLTLGNLTPPQSGGGDPPQITWGNTAASATIVDDDPWKMSVAATDYVSSERLPEVVQDYGYYVFQRLGDGFPADNTYDVSVTFGMFVLTSGQYYCPIPGRDYRLSATPVDENDEMSYLRNLSSGSSGQTITLDDGSTYYWVSYTATFPANQTTAALRLEPIFDWDDEGAYYALFDSPDTQLGEFASLAITDVTWSNKGTWNAVGESNQAEIEIKDGAILELYLDYDHNGSLTDQCDVEASILNIPCKVEYNDDDDNENQIEDRLEGVGANVPPNYAGVENEDDLYKAKLYAWVADLTGQNGQNYKFDVRLQNSPISGVSGITLWNESDKRTLFVDNFNSNHIDYLEVSHQTVAEDLWLEGVEPTANNIILDAICSLENPTRGDQEEIPNRSGLSELDGNSNSNAYSSLYEIDIDVDSDNNGYINTNNDDANGNRVDAEDELEDQVGKPITYFPDSALAFDDAQNDDYQYVPLKINNVKYYNDDYSNIIYCFSYGSNLEVCDANKDPIPSLTSFRDATDLDSMRALNFYVRAVGPASTSGIPRGMDSVRIFLFKTTNQNSTIQVEQVADDVVYFKIQDGTQTPDWYVPCGWTIDGVNSFTTPVPEANAVGPGTEGSGVITNDGNAVTKETYPNGFTLEFDYSFVRNTTPTYAEGYLRPDCGDSSLNGQGNEIIDGQDRQLMGFFGNSGVKIFGKYEIQIFDTRKLLKKIGYTPEILANLTNNERQTLKNNLFQNDNVKDFEQYKGDKIGKFISGIKYGTLGLTPEHLLSAYERQNDDSNHMVIDFHPTTGGYLLTVALNPVNNQDVFLSIVVPNSEFDGISDANKIVHIQSHWGTGVRFNNVRITRKNQN